MSIPTIEEITAAAKASALTTPRPSRAFWIEAIRSYIDMAPKPSLSALRVARTRGIVPPGTPDHETLRAVMSHTECISEAGLRAFFIELLIAGTDDPNAARIRWGAVFGLCEEAAR